MPGLSDLRVTLYDVFGYLLPGLVAFGAVTIFVWAAVFPTASLDEPHLSSAEWIGVLLTSYMLGHLVQAITGLIAAFRGKAAAALDWFPLTDIGQKVGVPALPAGSNAAAAEARAEKIYELCDIAVAQKGSTGDREIYQYREGFYRGLTVSLVLGLLAVVVRAIVTGDALVGKHHFVTSGEYFLACGVLIVAAILAFRRYRLFFNLKVHNTFGAFAVHSGLIHLD